MDIDSLALALALASKDTPVSSCTYALIEHFCTQLADIRRDRTEPLIEAARLVAWWQADFSAVHGELSFAQSSNAKVKPDWLRTAFSVQQEYDPLDILCAAETCFSLLVRVLAYQTVTMHLGEAVGLEHLAEPRALTDVLHGDFFDLRHIHNYCFPDAYSWFLSVWNKNTTERLRAWLAALASALATPPSRASLGVVTPGAATGDSFKWLYEALFPRQLRHALGEFYTPEWLADYTVAETFDQAGAIPWQTVCLDPTCGSGTFLQALITAIRRDEQADVPTSAAQTASAQPQPTTDSAAIRPATATEQLRRLCQVVRGFDVNLLAVIMARTNFLLAVIDLWDGQTEIDLPVDWFDVLDRPDTGNNQVIVSLHGEPIYCSDLRDAGLETAPTSERDTTTPVHERLQAAYIANRLRGAARPPADIVVGNPPWVNWEYLSKSVRDRTHHLWQTYAIFDASGRDRALAKEDLSTLLTYAVADRDLRPGGCLGFVLRQAVFKSKQNGAGFRRLQIGRTGPKLQVLQVDDLTLLQPFPGATTATAVVWLRKAEATVYPVPWRVWRPRERAVSALQAPHLPPTVTLDMHVARPVRANDLTSPWITLPPACLSAAHRVLGRNAYQARTGTFTGGANAVFWIRLQGASGDGLVHIENVTERAKRQAPAVTADVESLFVYPLLRGADVRRWRAEPQLHLLCPHTSETRMAAVPRPVLEDLAPRTLAYFDRFTDVLRARRGFSWDRAQLERTPYAIQRVGAYTFAPYKVVWRYIASSFITAVVSATDDPVLGRRLVLPNEKLMFIPTHDEAEAHYLCGVLSATPVRACIEQVMNPTSISAHVLENIAIPTFDPDDPLHRQVSELCRIGHALVRGVEPEAQVANAVAEVEMRLDEAVSALYGLGPADIAAFAELIAKR